MMRILLLCILLAFVSACASPGKITPDAPEWTLGESKHYPRERYLIGIGSGLNINDAQERARAEIAKQFQTSVQERSHQSQQYKSMQQQEDSTNSLEQQVSRSILSYSNSTITGIEISEQWYDEGKQQHYALATLDKPKARQQLQQTITQLDSEIQQHITSSNKNISSLDKARHIQRAIEINQTRADTQRKLQVVDNSGRGQVAPYTMAKLFLMRQEKIKNISIQPKADTESDQSYLPLLRSALAKQGYITDSQSADYQLTIANTLDPLTQENQWWWLRGNMVITLTDQQANTLGVYRWPLKASSTTEARTQQRLTDNIQQILESKLQDKLLSF